MINTIIVIISFNGKHYQKDIHFIKKNYYENEI